MTDIDYRKILIDEPFPVYLANREKYLTSHQLMDFIRCPKLYFLKKTGALTADPNKTSADFVLGSAAHKLILVRMMETNAGGLAELGRCAKSIKEDAMRRTIFGMLESVGANTSGTAITLRTAAGTATIGAIDRAGARAIEEQLCFAAKWSGMSWEEAGENISYEVDTSYMASQGTIQEFVSLMGANLSTGQPFLSKQNLYGIVQKLYPSTLTDWDTNELQKEDEGFVTPMGQAAAVLLGSDQ